MENEIQNQTVNGICSTCNYAKSCVYLARSKSPIWYCEEFDDAELKFSSSSVLEEDKLILRRTTKTT